MTRADRSLILGLGPSLLGTGACFGLLWLIVLGLL